MDKTTNFSFKGKISSLEYENSDDSLSVNSESSLKSYDLPRSKFRRYKPNRGREIVLVKEKSEKIDTCQVSDKETDEIDESEDEIEEAEEEEREGFWKRVLKGLGVLIVLMVLTFCISSSNSPSSLQAMEGFKEEYVKIHESFVRFLEFGNLYLDGSSGLMKVNNTLVYEDVCFGKVEEISDDGLMEIDRDEIGDLGELVEVEMLQEEESLEDTQENEIETIIESVEDGDESDGLSESMEETFEEDDLLNVYDDDGDLTEGESYRTIALIAAAVAVFSGVVVGSFVWVKKLQNVQNEMVIVDENCLSSSNNVVVVNNERVNLIDSQLTLDSKTTQIDQPQPLAEAQAPSVELLGEFIVGEMKSLKIAASEESVSESFEYFTPPPQKKVKVSKTQHTPTPTTLRRSSRLQSRSIQSP